MFCELCKISTVDKKSDSMTETVGVKTHIVQLGPHPHLKRPRFILKKFPEGLEVDSGNLGRIIP